MTTTSTTIIGAAGIMAGLEDVAGRAHLARADADARTWLRPEDYLTQSLNTVGALHLQVDTARRELIRFAVEHTKLSKRQICLQAGITRRTLDHWIDRWGQDGAADQTSRPAAAPSANRSGT